MVIFRYAKIVKISKKMLRVGNIDNIMYHNFEKSVDTLQVICSTFFGLSSMWKKFLQILAKVIHVVLVVHIIILILCTLNFET